MPIHPIILFVYKRPWHTKQVLDALSSNIEAKNSTLYIYCDGPKENADDLSLQNIESVRGLVQNERRFKEVVVIEQPINKGLANSIIDGVTEVIGKYGSAIIVEDDLLPGPGFLNYMNSALELYKGDSKVGCIHAWNYSLDYSSIDDSTFFLKGADCWGWGTWKDSWDLFKTDGKRLLTQIVNNKLEFEFNRNGTHQFTQMLQDQIAGKNDSWAIRWHASLFIHDKYCLHPVRPIVKNIGLDNSGTHCGDFAYKQEPVDFIEVKKIPVKESRWFYKAYEKMERANQGFNKSAKWPVLKKYIKRLLLR